MTHSHCNTRPTLTFPAVGHHRLLTSSPVPIYTAWWQNHVRMNNLPKMVPDSETTVSQTRLLWVATSTPDVAIALSGHRYVKIWLELFESNLLRRRSAHKWRLIPHNAYGEMQRGTVAIINFRRKVLSSERCKIIKSKFCEQNKREEASTHRCAKTHDGTVFCAYWPRPVTFWPQNEGFSRNHGRIFLCEVMLILAASVFKISCE